MRDETLSDTYMMFPSVVRAIRKPSNACHNTENAIMNLQQLSLYTDENVPFFVI